MKAYTEEEKLSLLRQYLESGLSKTAFSRSHDLCVMNLIKWLRKYGNPDLPQINEEMKKHDIPSETESLQEELIALRKELRQAEKLLKEEKLKNMANEMIIDLAESKYHIRIRKNSGAK